MTIFNKCWQFLLYTMYISFLSSLTSYHNQKSHSRLLWRPIPSQRSRKHPRNLDQNNQWENKTNNKNKHKRNTKWSNTRGTKQKHKNTKKRKEHKSNQIKCFLLAYMIYIILTKEHIYINKYIPKRYTQWGYYRSQQNK